jgi:hypothetical protein
VAAGFLLTRWPQGGSLVVRGRSEEAHIFIWTALGVEKNHPRRAPLPFGLSVVK